VNPARRRPWIVAGLAMIALALAGWFLGPPARADTVPGSGLGSYELSANAAGIQSTYSSAGATSPTVEGEVPDAQAQLLSGPFGEALSSLAWPGPIAANAGTTAVVLNAPIPPQYANDFNDPVRAQAETGSGPSSVTNSSYPGTAMTATATDDKVTSEADVDSAISPAAGFSTGNVSSSAAVALTGTRTALVSATSEVQSVTLAGGLITIKSVSSSAQATTDGTSPRGTGSTVVSGLTVDGVPATVDQNGLHLASTSNPADAAVVAAANSALSQAGVAFYAGQPIVTKAGGDVSYTSGSLVVLWTPSSSSGTFSVTLGGLTVSAAATPGSGSTFAAASPPSSAGTGSAGAVTAAGSPPLATGTGPAAPPVVTGSPTGAAPGANATGAAGASTLHSSPARASSPPVYLPAPTLGAVSRPLSAGWLALALIGALSLGIGSTKLPDRMFGDHRSRCKLEDPS
jgi:hypothetical protein